MDEQTQRSASGGVLGRRQVIGAAAAIVMTPAVVAVAYGAPGRGESTPAASPEATPGGTPEALQTVEAFDFGFEPTTLEVEVGETLELFSTGDAPHNFVIEGYEDEAVDFPQDGSSIEWTVPDDLEPGTYTFYCSIGNHRAQGMEGEITIVAAAGDDDEAGAASDDDASGTTVEAFEFGFDPVTIEAAPGDTIGLFSSGQAPHDFVIEGFEDQAVVFPQDGSTAEWTVPDDMPAGTYVFYCSVGNHRAQGMEGEITITE
ncbi:MAG TPA: plastocyanin/azurin family copper-binding protein [Thermomicrobiales bacterium]|jgi:plastocyanin|nr:plastocyanin/azurin family copper-binding protein [Thermomicrobiales bacterium]